MFTANYAVPQLCGTVALGLLAVVPLDPAASQGVGTTDLEAPRTIIAAQIRRQGYQCDNPRNADRDNKDSKPDQAVWLLDCGNFIYRVRLKPGMAAHVDPVRIDPVHNTGVGAMASSLTPQR